jgi:hypothetical protein
MPADLSEAEQRLVVIVDALASGRPIGHLADRLVELDRPTLRLVLAAFAHAGSSHTVRLAPLVSWSEP